MAKEKPTQAAPSPRTEFSADRHVAFRTAKT